MQSVSQDQLFSLCSYQSYKWYMQVTLKVPSYSCCGFFLSCLFLQISLHSHCSSCLWHWHMSLKHRRTCSQIWVFLHPHDSQAETCEQLLKLTSQTAVAGGACLHVFIIPVDMRLRNCWAGSTWKNFRRTAGASLLRNSLYTTQIRSSFKTHLLAWAMPKVMLDQKQYVRKMSSQWRA